MTEQKDPTNPASPGPPDHMSTVRLIVSTAPTSATTKDFTATGLGAVKGFLAPGIWADPSEISTSRDGATYGWGFCDTSNSRYATAGASDGQIAALQQVDRRMDDTACLAVARNGIAGSDPLLLATFDSLVTDGVRLSFATVDTSLARSVHLLLFGGDGCEVSVGDLDTTAGDASVSPGLSGPASFVLFTALGDEDGGDAFDGTERDDWLLSFGWAVRNHVDNSTLQQWCLASAADEATDPCVARLRIENTLAARCCNVSGTEGGAISVGSWTATGGFTATKTGGKGLKVAYMIVRFTDRVVIGGYLDKPGSTGVVAYSVGFRPALTLLGQTRLEVSNWGSNRDSGTPVVAGGCGYFDASTSGSYAFQIEDAAALNNTARMEAARPIHIHRSDGTGTGQLVASLSSIDRGGFSLNWENIGGGVARIPYLCISEPIVAPRKLLVPGRHERPNPLSVWR